VIDDRDDVSQRLARPGACRQHIALAGARYLDGLALVAVQGERCPARILQVLLDSEDSVALGIKEALVDQFVYPTAVLKGGIQ